MTGIALARLILLSFAVVPALIGALCIRKYNAFRKNGVYGRAKLIHIVSTMRNEPAKPVVLMTLPDGSQKEYAAQPNGVHRLVEKIGQEVEIIYLKKQVLGMPALNIYIIDDGHRRPYRLYLVSGVLLTTVAIAAFTAVLLIG